MVKVIFYLTAQCSLFRIFDSYEGKINRKFLMFLTRRVEINLTCYRVFIYIFGLFVLTGKKNNNIEERVFHDCIEI